MDITDEKKKQMRSALRKQEMLSAKAERKRLTSKDFVPLKIIGKGAIGQVRLVKKKDSGEIYAMKTMVKKAMVLKNQEIHAREVRGYKYCILYP